MKNASTNISIFVTAKCQFCAIQWVTDTRCNSQEMGNLELFASYLLLQQAPSLNIKVLAFLFASEDRENGQTRLQRVDWRTKDVTWAA